MFFFSVSARVKDSRIERMPGGTQSFESRLKALDLPPPGPAHYAARRALWLTPTDQAREPLQPSNSRGKLESLVNAPDAANSEEVWKAGLERVWKGLVNDVTLKKRMPMELVVRAQKIVF